jgi:uncharacterized membrane protein
MSKKHMLLMLVCCLVPIAGIAIIGALAIPVTSIVQVALALMCPLMMLFMMRSMGHGHEQHQEHHPSAPVEENKRETM